MQGDKSSTAKKIWRILALRVRPRLGVCQPGFTYFVFLAAENTLRFKDGLTRFQEHSAANC